MNFCKSRQVKLDAPGHGFCKNLSAFQRLLVLTFWHSISSWEIGVSKISNRIVVFQHQIQWKSYDILKLVYQLSPHIFPHVVPVVATHWSTFSPSIIKTVFWSLCDFFSTVPKTAFTEVSQIWWRIWWDDKFGDICTDSLALQTLGDSNDHLGFRLALSFRMTIPNSLRVDMC